MGLYDDLGIDKNASEAEIKKVFRKKAKSAHPDAGGDAEEFRKLSIAYAVLSDTEKRKKYDETGEIPGSGETEDNVPLTMALEIFFNCVEQNPSDLKQLIKATFDKNIMNMDQSIREYREKQKKILLYKNRIVKAPKNDFLTISIEHEIAKAERGIREAEKTKKNFLRAQELLNEYVFSVVPPKQSAMFHLSDVQQLHMQFGSGNNSTSTW